MTQDAKLKLAQPLPFITSFLLMLIPAYRAHAAGVPAVTSTHQCYWFNNYKYSGGTVICWEMNNINCVVCD